MTPFTLFLCVIMFFHTSEFALACIYMREELSFSSLLFSKQYCIAMGSALVEFCLEAWLFPGMKQMGVIPFLGFLTVLLGEVIRKTGMVGEKATHGLGTFRNACGAAAPLRPSAYAHVLHKPRKAPNAC